MPTSSTGTGCLSGTYMVFYLTCISIGLKLRIYGDSSYHVGCVSFPQYHKVGKSPAVIGNLRQTDKTVSLLVAFKICVIGSEDYYTLMRKPRFSKIQDFTGDTEKS